MGTQLDPSVNEWWWAQPENVWHLQPLEEALEWQEGPRDLCDLLGPFVLLPPYVPHARYENLASINVVNFNLGGFLHASKA